MALPLRLATQRDRGRVLPAAAFRPGLLAGLLAVAALTAIAVLAGPASAAPDLGPPHAGSWSAPLPGPLAVLRRFAPPPTPYSPGHRGVDLGAPVGTPVLSTGAGVVTYAGMLAGRGVITVRHQDGLRTTYEPVNALLPVGRLVARGQQIGTLGIPTGHCGPAVACLHWGLLRGSRYLDPLALLRSPEVRLYPPGGSLPYARIPAVVSPASAEPTASPPAPRPRGPDRRGRAAAASAAALAAGAGAGLVLRRS